MHRVCEPRLIVVALAAAGADAAVDDYDDVVVSLYHSM
jgi:hypothetical protein